jgi:hypothetical protein
LETKFSVAKLSRKIWIGVGAATVVGLGSPAPSLAQHATKHAAPAPAPGTEAPSGTMGRPQAGETYLTDGGPKDTRIRIYRDIALMRGHLMVGAELIELGHWDDALPHFLHPAEELYGAMERYIKLHKVTPFDQQLKAQGQAVKAKNVAAYREVAKVVDARLTNALTFFKRFMKGQPLTSFTARTMVEVLKVAQSEYDASIEGGRFGKVVEYHDSRGFVLYVEKLLAEHRLALSKVDAARFSELNRLIAELKMAWPSTVPPDKPVVAPSVVAEKVAAFEKAAAKFF